MFVLDVHISMYVFIFPLSVNVHMFICAIVTDINECSGDNHGCSQTCNNLPGSYKCGCWNGFQIDAEEKDNECRGRSQTIF